MRVLFEDKNLIVTVKPAGVLSEESGNGLTDCGILVMTAFWDDEVAEGVEKLRQDGNLVEIMMMERTPGTFGSEKEA